MIEFTNTEKKLNINEIMFIEKQAGVQFPAEYKEHLLTYNGGQCYPNLFSFIEDGDNQESFVDWFLAIYDGEYDNLLNYIHIYKMDKKRMPTNMIPIAHDPGGNLVCISTTGSDCGYIYFWNHEKEVDYEVSDDSDYSNLYLIAKSFKEFLNSLAEE